MTWDGDLATTTGCWNPPCIHSKKRDGEGCYMCDVMPKKFPQREDFKSRTKGKKLSTKDEDSLL